MLRDEAPLTPLAGCTDVYVALQFGTLTATRFVDLWRLDELRPIGMDGTLLRIGALATYAEIMASPLVGRRLPMLTAAAGEIGARQIQNRGTLGGNIANASPAGDTLPVLAAADAVIVLRSAAGERRVAVTEFFTGYRTSVRRAEELITAVEIPQVEGTQYWRKVGTRRAQAISKVMCAAVRASSVRVALGSVGPTVMRLPRTEAILSAGGTLEDAQHALRQEIAPIDDIRSTAAYRGAVGANLLADFWTTTSRRAARAVS